MVGRGRRHAGAGCRACVATGKPIRPIVSPHAPLPPLAGTGPNQCAVPTGTAGGGFGFHVESVRVRSSDT